SSVNKVTPPPVSRRKSPGFPLMVTCTFQRALRKRSSLMTCGLLTRVLAAVRTGQLAISKLASVTVNLRSMGYPDLRGNNSRQELTGSRQQRDLIGPELLHCGPANTEPGAVVCL